LYLQNIKAKLIARGLESKQAVFVYYTDDGLNTFNLKACFREFRFIISNSPGCGSVL